MRKSISLLISFSLLSCLSLNLYSQSAEEELDQVKLNRQLIGTWESEIGEDTALQFTCTQAGEGILLKVVYKSKGKVYAEGAGVTGYSRDRKTIETTVVWPNGTVTHDIGRFVTNNKLVAERFLLDSPTHAVGLFEYNFSPNSYSAVIYWRGQNITWEPRGENLFTFTKIK